MALNILIDGEIDGEIDGDETFRTFTPSRHDSRGKQHVGKKIKPHEAACRSIPDV